MFALGRVQRGNTYSVIKIYNSLPSSILSLKNERKQSENDLYTYLK